MVGLRRAGAPYRRLAHWRAAGLAAAAGWLAAAAIAAAGARAGAEGPARIESVRLGLGGAYKVGAWTPVRIVIASGEAPFRGRLDISTEDSDGAEVHYGDRSGQPPTAPAGGRVSLWRYIKFGRVRGAMTIAIRDERGGEAGAPWRESRRPEALRATQQWIVTVGEPVGVEEAVRLGHFGPSGQCAATRIEEAKELPDRWRGYAGVDSLVLTTSSASPLWKAADAQVAAIEQWVRLGGRMVLCVGQRGEQVFGKGGRLRSLRPGRLIRVIPQRNTAGLETYVGAEERLGGGGPQSAPLMTAVLGDVRGRIEAFEGLAAAGEQPMIIRYPFGLGQIVLAAFDLDQPPLADWSDRPRLAARLLGGAGPNADEGSGGGALGRVAHVGYEDLSGQLRSALDQFSDVTLVPFSWIAALVVVYIALIGPGDYFFLKKVVGRMHWSWITFPFLVALFGLLAFWLFQSLKSQRIRINQADLVDVDVSESLVRGAAWANLYSPRTDAYDLSLAPAPPLKGAPTPQVLLSWHGLPGKGLGGFDTRTPPPYRFSYQAAASPVAGDGRSAMIQGLPIPIASTRSVFAQWWSTAPIGDPGRLQATADGLLQGEVRNILSVPLTDGMLYYGVWAYRLDGEIPPGGAAAVGEQPLNLRWQLTRRRLVDMTDMAAPWDPSSRDAPRILEMMMFYQAAGGRAYTQLLDRHQGWFDLSDHLATGRAILVARGAQPASRLMRDGRPLDENYEGRWTFYRIVLPVTPAKRLRTARKAASP